MHFFSINRCIRNKQKFNQYLEKLHMCIAQIRTGPRSIVTPFQTDAYTYMFILCEGVESTCLMCLLVYVYFCYICINLHINSLFRVNYLVIPNVLYFYVILGFLRYFSVVIYNNDYTKSITLYLMSKHATSFSINNGSLFHSLIIKYRII